MVHSIIVLFMVLTPALCYMPNPPDFDVNCYNYGFKVQVSFGHPFKGAVYFKGHPFDPLCSFRASTASRVLEITFNVSLTNCGTVVQSSENGRSTMENTMIVQQHGLLETSDDLEKAIYCKFLGPLDYSNSSHSKYFQLADIATRLDVQLGYQLFGENLAEELNVHDAPFLVFSALGKKVNNINDINVKNCIAHEDTVLKENSLFLQMSHPSGCPNMFTDIISAFTVAKPTEEVLVAYAQIKSKTFKAKTNNLHITCGVQICKRECRDKCSKKKRQKDKLTAIVTHRISKRSIPTTTNLPVQPFELRNEFLKSTVKALAAKLMTQKKEPQNEYQIVEKRISPLTKDPSIIVEPTQALGISTHVYQDSLTEGVSNASFFHDKVVSVNFSNLFENTGFKNLTNSFSKRETDTEPFFTVKSLAHDLDHSTTESVASTEDLATSSNEINPEEHRGIVEDSTIDLNPSRESGDDSPKVNFNETDEDLLGDAHEDCVPKLRFVVVTIVLGFISATVILVCCGMLCHLRREKKKRGLDRFLLYNFNSRSY